MKKIVSEPRLIAMAIVAIGVILLVLGISAQMSGASARQVEPPPEAPDYSTYYVVAGVITILIGGLIAFIAGRRSKKDSDR